MEARRPVGHGCSPALIQLAIVEQVSSACSSAAGSKTNSVVSK